jgi:6-phosphofructokinase
MNKKRIGILTGGGDTQPLNAVLFSLNRLFKKAGIDYVGFKRGWEGLLLKQTVDFSAVSDYSGVGGSILKSSRVNLAKDDRFQEADKNLRELELDALIVIGGDDTLSNLYGIVSIPCIGLAKTIDNDVGSITVENGKIGTVNYFNLGYPTAADKISRFVSLEEGIRTTAYSHERIMIVESMGMHAGWLALASAFGRPDAVIIPEFPLDYGLFLFAIKKIYEKKRHAVVVIAEGSREAEGAFFSPNTATDTDSFGNPRFGGASLALRDRLKNDMKGFMEVRNINAVNPSYWYRSGSPSPVDRLAAELLSGFVFELIQKGVQGHRFVFIDRSDASFRARDCAFSDFHQTDRGRFPKRFIPREFYNPESFSATPLWEEYLDPIVEFRSSVKEYHL